MCDKKIVPWSGGEERTDFNSAAAVRMNGHDDASPSPRSPPRRKLSRSRRRRRGKREASPRRREGRRKSPQICTVTTADVEGGEPQTPVNPEKEYVEKGEGNLSCFPFLSLPLSLK